MPFTIAHTVAARPLQRLSGRRLVLPAVAVGAMAPDFEYLVHLSPTRTIGHTIPGLFILCLPSAMVVLFLWHRLVGPAVAALLRPVTGGLTAGWDEPASFGPPARFAVLCASILVGSFSHIAWDAFTHQGGVVVNLWSGFSHRVGPGAIPVYRWLQYGSSLFGMTLLGVWAHRAAQRPLPSSAQPEGDGTVGIRGSGPALSRSRRAVAAAVVSGLLLIGALGAVQGAGNGDPWDVLKGGAIGALAGAVLSLLAASAAMTRRLRRL
jgi:hypothetical protein